MNLKSIGFLVLKFLIVLFLPLMIFVWVMVRKLLSPVMGAYSTNFAELQVSYEEISLTTDWRIGEKKLIERDQLIKAS